ncbi:MAG: ABC transporter permease [Lachnospiraceae bacterium]|nr:ABC transporter permease [Lachnospiraceae bacterium]
MAGIDWSFIWEGFLQTMEMVFISTILAYVAGLPLGVILSVTKKGGLCKNSVVYNLLAILVNISRSIPFLIFLVILLPLTRLIVGTSIGTEATIVPLTIGAIPIVARMVEASLEEVGNGIVEAALAMGASRWQVITSFILPEAVPSLIQGAAINFVTILGYSAMAGFIGGGGLGAIAYQHGYIRYKTDVLLVTVTILVVIVWVGQELGLVIAKKARH